MPPSFKFSEFYSFESWKAAAMCIIDWQSTGSLLNEKLTSNKLNNQGEKKERQQTGKTEAWKTQIGGEAE
jgi:hypothetical protein